MQEKITCAGVESQLGSVHQGDAPLQLQSPVPGVTLPQYQPDPSRPATQPASRSAAKSSNGAAPSLASPGSTDSTIDRQATQQKQAAEKEQSQAGPTASEASSEHRAGDGSGASDGKVRLFFDRQRFHQQTLQLAQRLDKSTCVLGPYPSICSRPVPSWALMWSLAVAMQFIYAYINCIALTYVRATSMYDMCRHTKSCLACVSEPLRLHVECCGCMQAAAKAQFEEMVRVEFARIMSAGALSANEAAVQAVALASARAESLDVSGLRI